MKKNFLSLLIIIPLLVAFGATVAFCADARAGADAKTPSKEAVSKAEPAKASVALKKDSPKTAKATAKKKTKTKAKKASREKTVPSTWSPNRFPIGGKGYCTWYADGRFAEYHGVKLEFSRRDRTNAKTWFDRVSNLEKKQTPSVGDIVVFKASTKRKRDPFGHVAFVEAVEGDNIIVSQGNFNYPGHKAKAFRKIDGKKISVDLMVPGSKPGRMRVEGCTHEFVLAGYLHMPTESLETIAGKLQEEAQYPSGVERQIYGPEQAAAESAAN